MGFTVSEIRAARKFSHQLGGTPMPSEISIDILLTRIDLLEATLSDVKSFMEHENLILGAGYSGMYMQVCNILSFANSGEGEE